MSRRVQFFGLLLILIVAAALRLWQINRIPPGFHYDEAFEGLEAWRILTDPTYRPVFLTGNFGVPPLNAYANALMFAVFGWFGGEAGPTAMRVTAACFGILGVLFVYAAAVEVRKLTVPRVRLSAAFPLFAAASLAVMRWHIHFSRIGIEPVIVPVIWGGAIWLLLRGWRTGRWPDFALCGIMLAAGIYAYQQAWITPLLMVLIASHLLISLRSSHHQTVTNLSIPDRPASHSFIRDFITRRWLGLVIATVAAALLVAPLAWFFWQNPDLLLKRPAQLYVAGHPRHAAPTTVWHNLWVMAKMFGPFGTPGDPDPRRNIPGAPALNFWLAIPFYLGLIMAAWRIRRPAYSLAIISLVRALVTWCLCRGRAPLPPRARRRRAGRIALWIWSGCNLARFGWCRNIVRRAHPPFCAAPVIGRRTALSGARAGDRLGRGGRSRVQLSIFCHVGNASGFILCL